MHILLPLTFLTRCPDAAPKQIETIPFTCMEADQRYQDALDFFHGRQGSRVGLTSEMDLASGAEARRKSSKGLSLYDRVRIDSAAAAERPAQKPRLYPLTRRRVDQHSGMPASESDSGRDGAVVRFAEADLAQVRGPGEEENKNTS